MRDANGARFELLLGLADWGRSSAFDANGVAQPLAEIWRSPSASSFPLSYDENSESLQLTRRISRFRAARSDTAPAPSQRLGAAADRWQSVYWVANGGAEIMVLSAGSGTTSRYAHAQEQRSAQPTRFGEFAPLAEREGAPAPRLQGLAITSEDYLVVGVLAEGEAAGLRAYDLLAGGPPLDLRWPTQWPFQPFALAARPCGGLAVLDRVHGRVWLLDRRLGMRSTSLSAARASAEAAFTRVDGGREEAAAVAPPPHFLLQADATGGADPIAIAVLPDGALLVLDGVGPDGFALISLYVDGVLSGRSSTRCVLDVIASEQRADFVLRGYDLAITPTDVEQRARIVVAAADGNQCFGFELERAGGQLTLIPRDDVYPMRRFEGKGLVRRAATVAALRATQDSGLLYDTTGSWLPLIVQKRPRYAPGAVFETPLLDSQQTDCVWHRLMLDACVPPGCRLIIETRAADSEASLADLTYRSEPNPILRSEGSELAWLREQAPGDAARGHGTWELLFQAARGRYLQLRITLEGDALSTPRLFALRAWCPRFSYAQRYLPSVYREDEGSADFLERFLANFEGIFTELEDRIAALSALFDLRSAPSETLDWLASWLGLVFDKNVGATHKRLLLRFALPLYAYRGTTQGLRLGSELALSPCLRPQDFALPARSQQQPFGIRIIERYLTRQLPPALLGDALIDVPRAVADTVRWSPGEGAEGLHRRYQNALKRAGAPADEATRYAPRSPSDTETLKVWRAFSADTLGSVPQLADALAARWRAYLASLDGSARHGMGDDVPQDWPDDPDRRELWRSFLRSGLSPELRRWLGRWQGFLARRYVRIDAFAAIWGTRWPDVGLVPAPTVLPSNPVALRDWALFETRVEPMTRAAHRFSVLLPRRSMSEDAAQFAQHSAFARRVVELEKPAHTVFDVRSYWAMFRVGQTRLGLDTLLGQGSRDPTLAPPIVIGTGHVGAGRVALEPAPARGRIALSC